MSHINYKRLIKQRILTDSVLEKAISDFENAVLDAKNPEMYPILTDVREHKMVNGDPFIYYIWSHCFVDKTYALIDVSSLSKRFLDSVFGAITVEMYIQGDIPSTGIDFIYDFNGTKFMIFEHVLHGDVDGHIPFYKTRGDYGYTIDDLQELEFYLNYCKKLDALHVESLEYALNVFKLFSEQKLSKDDFEYNKLWIQEAISSTISSRKQSPIVGIDDNSPEKINSVVLQNMENNIVLFKFGSMTDEKIAKFKQIFKTDPHLVEIA